MSVLPFFLALLLIPGLTTATERSSSARAAFKRCTPALPPGNPEAPAPAT